MSVEEVKDRRLKFYEILDQLRDLDALMEECGGELTDAIAEQFDALEAAFDKKVQGIAGLIREREGEVEVLKTEIARLTARRRSTESTIASWKNVLLVMLRSKRVDKLEGLLKVAAQVNPVPTFKWALDPSLIPDAYRKDPPPVELPPPTLDLPAVSALWKAQFQELCAAQKAATTWEKEQVARDMKLPEGLVADLGTHIRIR